MDDFYALLFLAYAMCMLLYSSYYILMVFTQQENHREWKILPHNAKGINSQEKWNCLRNKVKDTRCSIIYIQETKIEHFDDTYLRKFCRRIFDNFYVHP
jgi:hypothetical protein